MKIAITAEPVPSTDTHECETPDCKHDADFTGDYMVEGQSKDTWFACADCLPFVFEGLADALRVVVAFKRMGLDLSALG